MVKPVHLHCHCTERKIMKNAIAVRVLVAMGTLGGLVAVVGAGTKWAS